MLHANHYTGVLISHCMQLGNYLFVLLAYYMPHAFGATEKFSLNVFPYTWTYLSTWASNELKGGNPQAAKMTFKIVMVLVVAEMVIIGMILFSAERRKFWIMISLHNHGWLTSSTFRVTFSHFSHVMGFYLEQNFWSSNLFIQGIPSTEHSFIIQFRIFSLEFRS